MSGHERLSGLISDAAIPPLFERNVAEEPTYTCKHIAIEPYENLGSKDCALRDYSPPSPER
jgi:hypothetical protein